MKSFNWVKTGGIILAIGAGLMLLLEFFWILDPPDEVKTRLVYRIFVSLFGVDLAHKIIPSSIFGLEFSYVALWFSKIIIPRSAIVLTFLLWVAAGCINGRFQRKLPTISLLLFLGFLSLWFLAIIPVPYLSYIFPLSQPIHMKYFFAFILADLTNIAIITGILLIVFNIKSAGQLSLPKIYFSFKGRIGRGIFWGVWLSIIALNYIIWISYRYDLRIEELSLISIVIIFLTSLLFIWIGLAVQIKRWHDRNKSGWMVLINLIPVVGLIWVFVELGFLKGTEGSNKYGEVSLR